MAEGQLRSTQVKSAIGAKPKHRGTLRALGLGRVGQTAVLPDRPETGAWWRGSSTSSQSRTRAE